MQALKDAGILLVVILLAFSVRFTPLEETGREQNLASLTPQTEAAPSPAPHDVKQIGVTEPAVPAKAVVVAGPEDFSIRDWVLQDGDEIVRSADIEAKAIEHCAEVLIHIRKAAEESRSEAIERETREVQRVVACSA